MKKYLAALALATAFAEPAPATTFPVLTTIYLASGVYDDGSPDNAGIATVANCSNVSGVTTPLRALVLNHTGQVVDTATFQTMFHGTSVRFVTHATFYSNEVNLSSGEIDNGVINIESLQSGVFCTFTVVPAAGPAFGFPLHAVRVNPHPGTVE